MDRCFWWALLLIKFGAPCLRCCWSGGCGSAHLPQVAPFRLIRGPSDRVPCDGSSIPQIAQHQRAREGASLDAGDLRLGQAPGGLFERLGQPGIVGEILAGVLVGPSVFGWLCPSDFLSAMGDLGAMFLLFRVGLEVKASELMKVGGTATVVASSGVVMPFVMGSVILLLWHASVNEAIFVGASMVATSVGITARVLSGKGLLHLLSSRIILAAAVIDDVLGLLVLAAVSSITRGNVRWLDLALTAVLATGFTVIVGKWGTATVGRVIPHVERKLRRGRGAFRVLHVSAVRTRAAGRLHGRCGHRGRVSGGHGPRRNAPRRVHDLAQGVSELLVPFFLAGIGLRVNLAAFSR